MLSNYETNGVLKKVTNIQAASTASSSVDLGQKELINPSSSYASAYPLDSTSFYPYSYLKHEDRSDQENDESNNETIRYKSANSTSYAYAHNSNGGAIKRGCEVVDGENEDDTVTMSSSSMSGCSRRSPPKKPKFVVTSEEMNEFFKLLHNTDVQHFLKRDSCCLISDKYALAMVFTYFKRAKFNLQEYTLEHFYLALYLASDIEEDVDEYKYEIFPWALGSSWRSDFSGFLRKRDALLRRIGYRAIVSRKCCEEVMSFKSEHTAWKRERAEDHGGATRAYLVNRSKRILSGKNDEEELNYPRLADEEPRPCPLCLINRGWKLDDLKPDLFIDLQAFKPNTMILQQSAATETVTSAITAAAFTAAAAATDRPKLADLTNRSTNMSIIITVNDSSINGTNRQNSPKKKIIERVNLAKRQKQLLTNQITSKESTCMLSKSKSSHSSSNLTNQENLPNVKSSKPANKTPKKSITKTNLTMATKFKHQQKQTDEIDVNLLKLGAIDSARNLIKPSSRMSSANKFNILKLSTTNLENCHKVFDLPRRASLAATDKLLIKDRPSDEDYEDSSDDDCYENDDDDEDENHDSNNEDDESDGAYENPDEVFTIGNEKLKGTNNNIKKHETLRVNARRSITNKICQSNTINHGIRKRTNYSLSSSRNLLSKSCISSSTSSSKLELNMNSFEWQKGQTNSKLNDNLATREVYI